MNARTTFFNFDIRQPVNQWLGIGLISAMCFWVVIYYFVNSTQIIGDKFVKIATTNTTNSQNITN